MKGREQATDGFEPVEPLTVEGDYSGERLANGCRPTVDLDTLAITKFVEKDVFVIVADAVGGIDRRCQLSVGG